MNAVECLSRTILLCRDYVPPSVSDEEILQHLQSVRILCVSDLTNLSSHAGQVGIITLASLLSRMGMQVYLSIPEMPLLNSQTPLSGASVREALVGSSAKLIPGATVTQSADSDVDLIFALGDSAIENGRATMWRLNGSEWRGALALEGEIEPQRFLGDWPVGAMVSAALAAGEAFKFAMRGMPLEGSCALELFEMCRSCHCEFDATPVPENGVDFGNVDIISGSAISQATLYALLRLPHARLSGRIFDDDDTEPSNLNRNMLTTIDDVTVKKVTVVERRCNPHLAIRGIGERFCGKCAESGTLASRVVVGVDHIPSRWEVQRRAPGWLVVGATSHFNVSSSSHAPTEACCGCLHPIDEPDGQAAMPTPTVSFVSFWAGLVTAVRLIRECLGKPCPPERQHLWMSPLRMDRSLAAWWMPVPPSKNCPVQCLCGRAVTSRS